MVGLEWYPCCNTDTTLAILAAEFYGGNQKLYDCANWCTELGGIYVEGYGVIKFCS